MNGTSRHTHGRQTGKNDFIRPTGHVRPNIQNHTSLPVVCPVSRFRLCPFSIWRFPFFTDFSFEVFLSNLPPLPFTSIFAPFSEPHQAVIFVLGAKVTPGLYGKARSSLLFSGKISSPSGSIFPKNLAFPNPYLFKHPKRKRPMRQKDALKKCRINERQIDSLKLNSLSS